MTKIPPTPFRDKPPARAADPLVAPERYRAHRFGEREWGPPDPLPLVTVAWGERAAVIRFTDAEAEEPLSAVQWSRAQEAARHVAAVDEEIGPMLYTSRTLVVEVPIAA